MLARCRAAAAERGLVVTLHESSMESMEFLRHYRSIYLAGADVQPLVDDDTAWRALTRIRAHLEPDGSALIPLFIPGPIPASALGVPKTHVTDARRDHAGHRRVRERDEAAACRPRGSGTSSTPGASSRWWSGRGCSTGTPTTASGSW